MIEAKYFKDYKHNYMILKCEEAKEGENYRRRMLAHNDIEGIVNCSVRNINGGTYLYYDISSKVTLENLYQERKMSYEQVRDFFEQISVIYRNLGQFLMEEKGLLLQPDCIFYDFTTGKYFGLYYPDIDLHGEKPYEQLMDFLLAHADTENQKLADIIYRIYEMSESLFFSLGDVLAFFDEPGEIKEIAKAINNDTMPMENSIANFGETFDDTMEDVETAYKNYDRNHESKDRRYESRSRTEQNKGTIYYSIFAAVSLCGIGAILWIYRNYELTPQETMMIMCCMAVMGLCLIFSASQVWLSRKRIRRMQQEESSLLNDIEDEFREEKAVALQNVLDKNMGAGTYTNYAAGRQREENCKTIFIDTEAQNAEYKLYAMDNKNKRHIELTKFPFTIGKMAGYVDCVLADDSISRLHARIEKEGDKILLTDMNSMNGTYKNGLRMEPSETVEIEPGDEIRFGKLNYCYR